MNQASPKNMRAPETIKANGFAVAAASLAAQRPVRRARLRKIASTLGEGPPELSEQALRDYIAKNPEDADGLELLAQVVARLGRRGEAVSLLARCLELAPDFAAARYKYARLFFELNDSAAALAQLELLLARDGRNPLFRQLKASVLESTGEIEQSLAICAELVEENPDRPESWISYGHALRAMGLQEKSIAAYRMALKDRPSFGTAYWSLANMKAVRFGEADIAAMLQQLKRTDISSDDRTTLEFGLGKAYEDARDYKQSFEHYMKGNAALRLRMGYDPDTLTSGVAANKALFTPAFFHSHSGMGCQSPDPIFVLGRPRSGSTLIEQILSSHSAIEATAELPYIVHLSGRLSGRDDGVYHAKYLEVLEQADAAALAALGEEYLQNTRAHRKLGRPFFIDKKPGNFAHVGMIQTILPNAKIIDARRNPAACCLSMFKHYSIKGRLRPTELGRFYRDYVALMAHFDSVLPGRIHRVIYENMVADPEAETRKLLDYLGLPFEESCLRFYENKRTILTPSSEQVRRPISGEAVDHWRNFEPWLGPMIKSLGSVLTSYPDVPEELR